MKFCPDDERWMALSLQLAEEGRGTTAPNPLVGAVVVNDGKLVGQGFHARAGQAHAEVVALAAAGERAAGGVLYVTLEPCCHYGRTPPCTEAILKAGIRRVVVALEDPNPKVAGGGIAQLRAAGMQVDVGLLEAEARRQNDIFLTHITQRRPFVLWKNAATLDGRIATGTGHSQWITGTEARREVHQLRSQLDAVLVGSGTVLADNPLLTARPLLAAMDQPTRVLVDRRGRIPQDAAVLRDASSPVLWFSERAVTTPAANADHISVIQAAPGTMDPHWILTQLAEQGITSVLLEGGPTLAHAFWQARLIDKVRWYVAPKIMGADGRAALGPLDSDTMDQVAALANVQCRPVGSDWVFEGYPPWTAWLRASNDRV